MFGSSSEGKTETESKTYVDFACFVLLQNETQDLLAGTGTQAQEQRPLVVAQFPQAHWKKSDCERGPPASSVSKVAAVSGSTLALPLASLKQGELGGIVHHGELVEQSLDHLPSSCLGADVQVLGRVFGEVEGRPPSEPPARVILLRRGAQALTRRQRNGANQLEVNFDETRVDPVFILPKQKCGDVSEGSQSFRPS